MTAYDMRISDWSSDVCSSDLLNSEQNGRQRCTENGGHASRGARDEQRLALCRTQAETLGEQRPDGSAGHNDRPFRTERTAAADGNGRGQGLQRSEEHTSELQSLMRISYAVFCLKKKT